MEYRDFEFIKWSKTFSCGIKLIDEQHKKLIDLVNDLFSHVAGDVSQEHEYFNLIIREMINYIKVHFVTEEKIMNAFKFPGYAEHKKAHENFIMIVVEAVTDYRAGKRYILALISRFLKDWVLSHIAVMDKQYFDYFKKIASRKDDGKLSITAEDVARFG